MRRPLARAALYTAEFIPSEVEVPRDPGENTRDDRCFAKLEAVRKQYRVPPPIIGDNMPSKISNFFVKGILRSPLHPLLGPRFAVIAVTGVKTGKSFATPINITSCDGGYMVVSRRNRTWWRNLRGGRSGLLTASGKTLPVVGRVIEEPTEVVAGLDDYLQHHPGHARYFQVKLDSDGRPLAADLEEAAKQRIIVRLTPRRSQPGSSSAA